MKLFAGVKKMRIFRALLDWGAEPAEAFSGRTKPAAEIIDFGKRVLPLRPSFSASAGHRA